MNKFFDWLYWNGVKYIVIIDFIILFIMPFVHCLIIAYLIINTILFIFMHEYAKKFNKNNK